MAHLGRRPWCAGGGGGGGGRGRGCVMAVLLYLVKGFHRVCCRNTSKSRPLLHPSMQHAWRIVAKHVPSMLIAPLTCRACLSDCACLSAQAW